ncbi:MAG: DNA recombination protein RmuC [Bacteroidales bacterium]|nr:DNA recombination protein RmuC [Bacteroidales bacterium]
MEFLFLATGIILGGFLGWIISKTQSNKFKHEFQQKLFDLEKQKSDEVNAIDKEKSIIAQQYSDLQSNFQKISGELDEAQTKNEALSSRIARAEVEYKNLQEKLESQKKELEEIQKKFTTEFENIANRILKINSQEFTLVNKKNIDEILTPLKDRIQTFEKKVEETYHKGLKDQTDLRAELKKLYELNFKISEEANNLTRALKSDTKKQGNWGEIILERVLERSGLVKGQEYDTQITTRNDEGELIRPDVVVKLPDNKHIIIDSKVSLVAYESFINEDEPEIKENFLRQHIESIKNHIKGLSEKNYQNATLFDTPDFVLLFMPVESAFSLAIQNDVEMFNFAWEKKIVMVSPTTLLATLRTIASIWKHEKQTQNAMEIARQGGALYDKFVGFLEDLEDLGAQIGRVSKTYEEAKSKLTDGRGNLIRQVENLKKLGAKTSKSLPEIYLDENDN